MTHCKNTQIKRAYIEFNHIGPCRLSDCYNRYSEAKEAAYDYCLDLVNRYNGGWSYRIISYNTTMFTFGFIGEIDGKPAFFYITRDYDRYIYLDELEG